MSRRAIDKCSPVTYGRPRLLKFRSAIIFTVPANGRIHQPKAEYPSTYTESMARMRISFTPPAKHLLKVTMMITVVLYRTVKDDLAFLCLFPPIRAICYQDRDSSTHHVFNYIGI